METTYAQLMALFVAWRDELDSEPFAHETEWTARLRVVCRFAVTEAALPSPRRGDPEV